MRKMIFAAVAVIPTLIHAQAISPAQPESRTNTVLVSRISAPAKPGTGTAMKLGGTPYKPSGRTFSGIVPPELIETAPVQESVSWNWKPAEAPRTAVVKVVVGANGVPTDVRMLQGLGGRMDNDVVSAVSRYTFQPGTLNNKNFPMEVELTVRIHGRN
jgi:outer membrane biosynthesis protein TonB